MTRSTRLVVDASARFDTSAGICVCFAGATLATALVHWRVTVAVNAIDDVSFGNMSGMEMSLGTDHDTVGTGGGDYQIVSPTDTAGSTNDPKSITSITNSHDVGGKGFSVICDENNVRLHEYIPKDIKINV